MPDYESEIVADFPEEGSAKEFCEEYESVTGNQAEREGTRVIANFWTHGDEISLTATAEALGAKLTPHVIVDNE